MTLGKRIKAARKRFGITQREIAKEFDISPAAVSSWERDETVPEFDKLGRLALVLKVPDSWLIKGTGDPPQDDEIASLINRLTPAQKRQAIRFLRMLAEDEEAAA